MKMLKLTDFKSGEPHLIRPDHVLALVSCSALVTENCGAVVELGPRTRVELASGTTIMVRERVSDLLENRVAQVDVRYRGVPLDWNPSLEEDSEGDG